jgi:hypothetical protein
MTGVYIALAAGIPGIIAAVIGVLNRTKIAEIHVLVNSKMDQALSTIAGLRFDAATTALGDASRADTDVKQAATQVTQDATTARQAAVSQEQNERLK